eukprot:TRINITY_DN1689_c0_g1_i1.p1 TRINITY_DN1689_c0_g1~~TRINITY_DN1689_c0_g1_i1.p1  ORF type:complete len:272 (-),score=46.55 TRINITY_DN1689_c0_g1_i1:710-1525(-)
MKLFVCLAAALASVLVATASPGSLPSLNIDPSTVTVSGISAGGAAAVQFQVAFSSLVRGSGVVAGVPFYCAQDALTTAELSCMDAIQPVDIATLMKYVQQQATAGSIDDPSNLKTHEMFLWSGTKDSVVKQATMVALRDMMNRLGVANISATFNVAAEHGWVTNDYGNACGTLGSPFIQNCNVDWSGRLFTSFYGKSPYTPRRTDPVSQSLTTFDQTVYASASSGLDSSGYIYVPKACHTGRCGLHINFHGCQQGHSFLGDKYVTHTDLNG